MFNFVFVQRCHGGRAGRKQGRPQKASQQLRINLCHGGRPGRKESRPQKASQPLHISKRSRRSANSLACRPWRDSGPEWRSMFRAAALHFQDIIRPLHLAVAEVIQVLHAIGIDPSHCSAKPLDERISGLPLRGLCVREPGPQLAPRSFYRIQILRTLWVVLQQLHTDFNHGCTRLLRPQGLFMILQQIDRALAHAERRPDP